jgi:large conductance mechanosensitive channel
MSGFLKEFREFAVRGNVVDLAVAVVIGGAFGKIVSSLVADVLTPPIGLLLGGMDFAALGITLREAAGQAPAVRVNYGKFLQAIFDFVVIAFAIFSVVKAVNRFKQEEPPAPPPGPSPQERLLAEIRDLLKTGR